MNPIVAFVVVMAVWTVSEFVARKTKSLLSSLFVASLIFLVGFLSGIFPEDLLASSSLLALAGVVVGIVQGLASAYLDPIVGGAVGSVLPFVLMLLVLLIRPTGMFGWKTIERV